MFNGETGLTGGLEPHSLNEDYQMTQHEQPGNGPTDERKLRCAVLVKMGNFIVAKFEGREENDGPTREKNKVSRWRGRVDSGYLRRNCRRRCH